MLGLPRHAAAQQAKMQEEEEQLTVYKRDLTGWEFKIVRSVTDER